MKNALAAVVLACTATAYAHESFAQRFPGRGGGGEHSRDMPRREREARPAQESAAQDPFTALARELPSLKVDLLVRREQLDAWVAFERGVRELADMDRQRRRSLLALREAEAAPSAGSWIAALADEDRQRAEASAELRRRYEALQALLDETQRRTLDRRVILSQTETLGRGERFGAPVDRNP